MNIKVLLPALLDTKEQIQMTNDCRDSLVSKDCNIEIIEDNKVYDTRVAGVWNAFLDKYRYSDRRSDDVWYGSPDEYDYLMITANDTIADPNAIDYMVKCAEENPNAAIITGKVDRNYNRFMKKSGKREYTSELTKGLIDPACFLIRRGVIEKVGRIDDYFPVEFVERDYIHRCKLAGYDVVQPDVVLWYHPPFAGTIGNDDDRLRFYLRRYLSKWGGDANAEVYKYPFNDLSLDYTYCEK